MALDRITKNNQFSKPGPYHNVTSAWINYIIDNMNLVVTSLGTIKADTISEYTAAAGVTVDGVLIKDNAITVNGAAFTGIEVSGVTTTGMTITNATNTQLAITTTAGAAGFSVTGTVQTSNDLNTILTSTTVTSAAVMSALSIQMTASTASADNMFEVTRSHLVTAVRMGTYANAIVGKISMTTTGYVTGIAGVICAELGMPSTAPAGGTGTYTCFEAEINMASVTSVPVSALYVSVWGTQAGSFDDNGYIMDISGLTKATAHCFQDNNNTATQALRIRVNGVKYYILLSDTSD